MLKPLAFLALALSAYAQQTIFNVPSADVANKGDWFYQHQTVVRAWGTDKRWVQTNSFGYGIGHNIELDASWYNLEPGCTSSVNAGWCRWVTRSRIAMAPGFRELSWN